MAVVLYKACFSCCNTLLISSFLLVLYLCFDVVFQGVCQEDLADRFEVVCDQHQGSGRRSISLCRLHK